MRVAIIYREASEHGGVVRDYLRDFKRRTGKDMDIIDPDSREGASLCETYDIMEYPTILATDSNGVLQTQWRGIPLPTINEVSYYVQ